MPRASRDCSWRCARFEFRTVPEVRERPGIEDGKLVIRPILKLGVTLDHRVMDGYKVGQLSAELKLMFQDPEKILGLAEKIPVSYGAEVEKPIEPHR